MKILITGATGFLGSHLLEVFSNRSDLKDHIVYANYRSANKIPQNLSTDIIWLKGDVEDLNFIDQIEHLDCVIHTAGIVHSYDEEEFYKTNAEGVKNIVLKLKEKFDHLHFFLLSSLAAKGPAEARGPVSAYGKSKLKGEDYLSQLAPQTWTVTIIRPPMIIGPRDTAVLDIFKMVQTGLVLRGGNRERPPQYSIVCVHDLVSLIELLAQKKKGGTFYSAFPEVYSFNQLINSIAHEFKKTPKIFIIPNGILKFVSATLGIINKIIPMKARLTPDKVNEIVALEWITPKEEIEGFKPIYDLDKTVKITFDDYKSRNWIKS